MNKSNKFSKLNFFSSYFDISTYHLINFFSIFLSLPFLAMPLVNPDIFWHLSAGRYIFENLKVPHVDFLSWTMYGKEWIDFEWLTQIIYYWVYLKSNFIGLYFLKILLIIFNLVVISRIILLFSVNRLNLIWMIPFTAASFLSSSDIRPENFSALFFSLTLYFLEKQREILRVQKGTLIFFSIQFAIWSNLHGGFLYGLFLIFIYGLGSFFNENMNSRGMGDITFNLSRKYFYYLLFSFLFTFINPYGWKIYKVIYEHLKYVDILKNYIWEWNSLDITFKYIRPFIILMFSTAIIFFVSFFKRKETDFIFLFLLVSFIILVLNHIRNSMYASVIFVAVLVKYLREFLSNIKNIFRMTTIIVFLLFLHFNFALSKYYQNFSAAKFVTVSFGLSSFLKENKEILSTLKMFNIWVWGGWLGWELYPDYKVFVDGRYIFHPYLETVVKAMTYPEVFEKIEKENDIGIAIIKPHQIKIPVRQKLLNGKTFITHRPYYLFILPKIRWALVFFDERVAVFVRRDKVDCKWLKEKEYKYFRPYDVENLKIPIKEGELKITDLEEEIKRHNKQLK